MYEGHGFKIILQKSSLYYNLGSVKHGACISSPSIKTIINLSINSSQDNIRGMRTLLAYCIVFA